MNDAIIQVPPPRNEPVLAYTPGSPEKAALKSALAHVAGEEIEIPCIIGGERVLTGRLEPVVMPHDHGHVLARFHVAGPTELARAARAAMDAKREWENMRWEARVAVILRAAELLAGRHRMLLNAATMLGQSKTCHQAEIDAACELIDFWRFNCAYAGDLYAQQPASSPGVWNQVELRPLEGFVFALTPFNFTAIAGNLPTAPVLMGNTAVWKPSESQTLAAFYTYQILEEAGLPPGVINFVPGFGHELAPVALTHEDFGGLHFTGSTTVFRSLWKMAAEKLDDYRSYPRIVGETGGKDFIVAHASADEDALVTAIVRGGYEYQGQKCSAASRVYVPRSVWARIESRLIDTIDGLAMGDVRDFRNFVGAVVKQAAFDKHHAAIEEARGAPGVRIAAGGVTDASTGWFVRPTLLVVDDPGYRTMKEELFGPIVSLYVYPDHKFTDVLELVDQTSPYGLTGAVFARERGAVEEARQHLRHAAGNFYINDKPTGAVVGQQPFGGARASGTDDKAGSAQNLLRWTAARTIKETFAPPTDYRYGFMDEE
ncbi:L-glutamate gamma-semialdehyde dehydrogenase [Haliangium sp.]|uniref:L-glutamate gamma-semialdehyde dehydrogenase n=1 Tax=Haliangium sp. TaxID=2663208 RepID=UPI003D0FB46C